MRQRWPVHRGSYHNCRGKYRGGRRCGAGAVKRGAHRRGCGCKIFLVLALTAGLLILLNEKLGPMVQSAVAQQAGQVSVQTVNRAVQQVLDENPLPENYLAVVRDTDGTILSVDMDAASVNQLKTKLNLSVQQALGELGVCSVAIPIGSLLGGSLLRGLGPDVHLRFTVAANAFCNLVSQFDSAGINQSRHMLSLVVTTEIYAMIPGSSAKNVTETTFPVAETIIVGKVPSLYWGDAAAADGASSAGAESDA
ncbi:MAG: sporulation protein YunB [Acutalibacteraceae bacterium]|jgi:sporulation protein YunB